MTAEHLKANAADELARGRAALAAAEYLLAADFFYDAASRAYSAVFHFARALVWATGDEPRSHQGVAHLLHLHYVRTGKLPPDTDRLYAQLQTFREKSDDTAEFVLDRDGATDAVNLSRLLVGRLGALLGQP